jgi:hypothetical protein
MVLRKLSFIIIFSSPLLHGTINCLDILITTFLFATLSFLYLQKRLFIYIYTFLFSTIFGTYNFLYLTLQYIGIHIHPMLCIILTYIYSHNRNIIYIDIYLHTLMSRIYIYISNYYF